MASQEPLAPSFSQASPPPSHMSQKHRYDDDDIEPSQEIFESPEEEVKPVPIWTHDKISALEARPRNLSTEEADNLFDLMHEAYTTTHTRRGEQRDVLYQSMMRAERALKNLEKRERENLRICAGIVWTGR